jgi:hypothetical protein
MNRTAITAEVVAKAEQMMALGAKRAKIAAKLGLTPYVLRIIARYRGQTPCGKPIERGQRHMRNSQLAIDAMTIRMIQRMLEVNILPYGEIAREAGVSFNTVNDVAAGKRLAISKRKPYLQKGEQFLAKPIRCRVCLAPISVVPCRACYTRQKASSKKIRLTSG